MTNSKLNAAGLIRAGIVRHTKQSRFYPDVETFYYAALASLLGVKEPPNVYCQGIDEHYRYIIVANSPKAKAAWVAGYQHDMFNHDESWIAPHKMLQQVGGFTSGILREHKERLTTRSWRWALACPEYIWVADAAVKGPSRLEQLKISDDEQAKQRTVAYAHRKAADKHFGWAEGPIEVLEGLLPPAQKLLERVEWLRGAITPTTLLDIARQYIKEMWAKNDKGNIKKLAAAMEAFKP